MDGHEISIQFEFSRMLSELFQNAECKYLEVETAVFEEQLRLRGNVSGDNYHLQCPTDLRNLWQITLTVSMMT